MKRLIVLFTIFILGCQEENSIPPDAQSSPKLLIGLSLQQHKNSMQGLEGYVEGLDYAVANGINLFGMSPEWNVLEPKPNIYALQDYLSNPLRLLDQDKKKLQSYILVLKMLDTNLKLVPDDLKSLSFDDPELIRRFSLLLDEIYTKVLSIERVSHILIGNEIDGFLTSNPDQVEAFRVFFLAAIQKIHALKPDVKVGTVITFNSAKRNPQLLNTFSSEADFICYTYYPDNQQNSTPWQMRHPNEVKGDIDWMVQAAGDKPIAFTEIGYPSSPDNSSSEIQQSEFIKEMFSSLKPHILNRKLEFLYYHGMYDYPDGFCTQYAQQQGVESTYICAFMNNLGLIDWETGQAKEAWTSFVSEIKAINKIP